MLNIAVINEMNDFHKKYIEELNGNDCSIQFYEPNSIIQNIDEVDSFIINDHASVGQNCEIIMTLRGMTDKFIWLLSDHSTKTDRLVYYKLGIDGVFDQNLDPEEFSLFVHSIIGKFSSKAPLLTQSEKAIIRLNSNNLSAVIQGKGEIRLTRIEFMVMEYLINHKGETITYEELSREIWKELGEECRYRISNVIFHIRKKIEDNTNEPKFILTIRSRGYMFSA